MPPSPIRFRRGLQECLLVSPRNVLTVSDREAAASLLEGAELEPAQAEAMVEALLDGSWVAVRVDPPTRLLDAPQVRPLVDPTAPVVDDPRPTWISVEVVHATGISTDGLELRLSTAEGRELHGRLGTNGHWRSDDVARGTCTLTLLDHDVLRARPRVVGGIAAREGEKVWQAGKTRTLELATAAHHRIRITSPRALRFSV